MNPFIMTEIRPVWIPNENLLENNIATNRTKELVLNSAIRNHAKGI
jgi:hypothetical protein